MRLWRASHPTLVVELKALAVMDDMMMSDAVNSALTLPTIDKGVHKFVWFGQLALSRVGGLGAWAARHHQKMRLPPRSPQAALIAVSVAASRSLDPRLQSDQKVTHNDTS